MQIMSDELFIREEFSNAHREIDQHYGGAPYEVHLKQVVGNCMRYIHHIPLIDRENVIDACGGHDTIEDTLLTYKDVIKVSNKMVADLIYCVTNERGHDKKEILFKTLPKIWADPYAIFIKLCDRLANGRNSKDTGHSLYKKYKNEYPIFRFALKVDGMYEDMWTELDEIFAYDYCL